MSHNPWTILGWIVLVFVGAWLTFIFGFIIVAVVRCNLT